MWDPSPQDLKLQSNEVHVWQATLNLEPAQVDSLMRVLLPDEQVRASRFYFQKNREHFIVARGSLRVILGRYLNTEPEQLQFRYNSYGKPALIGQSGSNGVRFNLSHSRGLALYAIARGREIGVDLEYIRSDFADGQIADRFFSLREAKALGAIPTDSRIAAFFNCWTRKEAYIKARGKGLTLPLDQFEVSLVPGEPATLLRVSGNPDETSRWSLRELLPASGYVAALAVEGHDWQLKCWQWQGDPRSRNLPMNQPGT